MSINSSNELENNAMKSLNFELFYNFIEKK